MNINNLFKNAKNNFNPKNIGNFCCEAWINHHRILFFSFSFSVILLGIFLWYKNIYRSDWDAEKKNQYKNSQNKNIELEKKEFDKILMEIDRKNKIYNDGLDEFKDVFESYIKTEKPSESTNPTANVSTP